MNKHLLSIIALTTYIAFLIKVMVFKDIPLITIGSLILNFGGTGVGEPNFIPFETITPYLTGDSGWIIAGINLAGNILLLVPVGFLIPLVFRNSTWKQSLILSGGSGLLIEVSQVLLHVGIFDIDDVILNALGVMVGFWSFLILMHQIQSKNYKTMIGVAGVSTVALIVLYVTYIYPITNQADNQVAGDNFIQSERFGEPQKEISQADDLCEGTGGTGVITQIGYGSFTMKQQNGEDQLIHLTPETIVLTSTDSATTSDLRIGDNITLVGGPNPDGSFNAATVLVCLPYGPQT